MGNCRIGFDPEGNEVWFVHIPHTGGNSIANWFRFTSHDFKWQDPEHPSKHYSVAGLLRSGVAKPGAKIFSMVRNPWDRAVTCYFFYNPLGTPWGFKKWLLEEGGAAKVTRTGPRDMLCNTNVREEQELQHVSAIARFESGERALRIFLDTVELSPLDPLPHHHKTVPETHDYRKYYDDVLRVYIAGLCWWEIGRFKYRFGGK